MGWKPCLDIDFVVVAGVGVGDGDVTESGVLYVHVAVVVVECGWDEAGEVGYPRCRDGKDLRAIDRWRRDCRRGTGGYVHDGRRANMKQRK